MLPLAISLISLSSFCLLLEQSALKGHINISMYRQACLPQPFARGQLYLQVDRTLVQKV